MKCYMGFISTSYQGYEEYYDGFLVQILVRAKDEKHAMRRLKWLKWNREHGRVKQVVRGVVEIDCEDYEVLSQYMMTGA